MTRSGRRDTVLMIAYTYYESDPRVIREAEAALDAGFEVDFLALKKPGTAASEMVRGVKVIRFNQSRYRGAGHARYVAEYLKFFLRCCWATTLLYFRRGYRAIHVNNMPDFLVFCTIVPRLLGAKVILDIHDPMPNTFASKFRGEEKGLFYQVLLWQEKLSAAYSNRVITVHHPVKDGILVKHGLRTESIGVIANFADDRLFPLRPAYPVQSKVRFVFHGTILERSGLGMLMEALAQVHRRDRVVVRIIGEGDFSAKLKEMIDALDLTRVVEFDNHSYPVHEICEHLTDCHVGLVPLEISSVTNYALPLKLLEYISLGMPVVTVRSYAISYYFGEKDCLFFEWNDAKSLGSVIERIADDPGILREYRDRSLALRDRFSWSGEKKKYAEMLHELISE